MRRRKHRLSEWGEQLEAKLDATGTSKQDLAGLLKRNPATLYRWMRDAPPDSLRGEIDQVVDGLGLDGGTGSPTDQLSSNPVLQLYSPLDDLRRTVARAVADGQATVPTETAVSLLNDMTGRLDRFRQLAAALVSLSEEAGVILMVLSYPVFRIEWVSSHYGTSWGTGYSGSDLKGASDPLAAFIHPDDIPTMKKAAQMAAESRRAQDCHWRMRDAEGQYRERHTWMSAIYDFDDNVQGILALTRPLRTSAQD